MTQLIGLAGTARSGKDEAAKALISMGWERRAFADVLRSFALAVDPIVATWPGTMRLSDLIEAHGWDHTKTAYPEVRRLLQRLGVEGGRDHLGEDVWVDATLSDLGTKPVVVTDVRFPNEMKAIRSRGGIVVRIERPGIEPPTNADGSVHVSETALAGAVYDVTIYNDRTVADLHEAIVAVARHWPYPVAA